ncbi:MAG TPA: molybdenum-pterin-binding protein [Sulfurovum sp. UBA12169]|nr:MAG TPA: molybdenum-pterin-binding protein [Sulfurovum sp. UBA12169]
MNVLHGKIKQIQTVNELSKIEIDLKGHTFVSLVIDIDSFGDIAIGKEIKVLFKEAEVIIGTNESIVSASNAFVSTVKKINQGEILSEVFFDFEGNDIISIITASSLQRLQIQTGKEFLWFVKANEVTLQKGTK